MILGVFAMNVFGSANWPQFRGPDGQGHVDTKNLPLFWSETNNIRWKTAIHGRAWSSPVIWGSQIWLTSATEDGKELFGICVEAVSGRIVRDIKLFEIPKPQYAIAFNTYGSPTPVVEQGRVYLTFGSPGTACLDSDTGAVLWERRDFVCNHFRGAGSSPILSEDKLIMNFDGSDFQFVVALDKRTGRTLWKTDRSIDYKDLNDQGKPSDGGDWRKAFSTPIAAIFNQQSVILSLGSKALYAYQPSDGLELWHLEDRNCHSGSSRPVIDQGTIYYCAGFPRGELLAVRPSGVATEKSPQILWKHTRDVSLKPSIVTVSGFIFMVEDAGVASCLRSANGEVVWRHRIEGHYSASPVCTPDRVYACNEEGKTTVFAAGPEFKILAENQLDDGFLASPAVSGDALFLRSRTSLYRIEQTTILKGSQP